MIFKSSNDQYIFVKVWSKFIIYKGAKHTHNKFYMKSSYYFSNRWTDNNTHGSLKIGHDEMIAWKKSEFLVFANMVGGREGLARLSSRMTPYRNSPTKAATTTDILIFCLNRNPNQGSLWKGSKEHCAWLQEEFEVTL